MPLSPKLRPLAYLPAIAGAIGVIIWTETYTWHRVAEMRKGDNHVITQDDIAALHHLLTWSSVVLLAMGALLAALLYRGVIAPLRANLRHSQITIERQEKLASLGILAAGIAHEIRNPLTSIRVRLFTQQALLTKGSEEFEDNVFLTDEIARLEQIVKNFLEFARPADPRFLVVKATQPPREVAPLLAPELRKSNIALKEDYLADPTVRADPAQLKQVLINLVKNAADAMGQDGTVTLRTRTETRRRGPRATTKAIIEVADTGPGIPPEVRARLFDPFFTTKASGTGLGLSIAARIVEKHGGTLEFSTELHRGTTFRIVLPIVPP